MCPTDGLIPSPTCIVHAGEAGRENGKGQHVITSATPNGCADALVPPNVHTEHAEEAAKENHKISSQISSTSRASSNSSADDSGYDGELLSKMRAACEKQGCSMKDVGNATLLRFLRARSMNVDKASQMFVQHQNWRASYVPLGYVPESECEVELAAKKLFLQGKSQGGFPVTIVHVRKHDPSKRDLEELKRNEYQTLFAAIWTSDANLERLIIYYLDKTIASAGDESGKLIIILDLKGIGYKHLDVRGFIAGFGFLQAYYPERLSVCYMVNTPSIFMRMWKVVQRFLDKATKAKIVFVERDKMAEVCSSCIDMDILPTEYGGKADLTLLQDAVVPNWPPIQRSTD